MNQLVEVRGGVDKSSWGHGEWQDEPDERRWVDAETGYPCEIFRALEGSLCGYVGVPPGHPSYGVRHRHVDVEVHGGLTFSMRLLASETGLWWFGFDCGHPGDVSPNPDPRFRNRRVEMSIFAEAIGCDPDQANDRPDCVYRNIAYVTAQVESLARQLKAMETTPIDPAATGR